MSTAAVNIATADHEVVSQQRWLEARRALLAKERELTHLRDEVSKARLELPWERVEKRYVFDGPNGKVRLEELFDGRSQLMVYHFMFGPEWKEGCPSCSYLADGFDGTLVHLAARDVTLMCVSKAPMQKIEAFKNRMGWRFNWVSSFGNDFNRDYNVSFSKEELAREVYYNYAMNKFGAEEAPGLSAFYRAPNGEVFHTYSGYARGLDGLVGTYNFLDMAPKGRNEDGLVHPMAWVRHHDRYAKDYIVDATAAYRPPEKESSCCSAERA